MEILDQIEIIGEKSILSQNKNIFSLNKKKHDIIVFLHYILYSSGTSEGVVDVVYSLRKDLKIKNCKSMVFLHQGEGPAKIKP